MYSPFLRFALIALLLVSSVAVLVVYAYWGAALMLFSTALLLLFGHFRFGTIVSVLWALRKGNPDKAETLLLAIKRPHWLSKRYQAYYYFAMGLVAFYRKRIEEGVAHFEESLRRGLSGKQELAIAHLNLAHAAFLQRDKAKTRAHIDVINAQNVDDLYLKQRVSDLEQQLNSIS